VKSEDKHGVVAPSTPRPLAELDLALLESARGAGDARLSDLVRVPLAAIESAMARGLASPLGSFSGGAAAPARKARDTGRRFVVAVAALVPGAACGSGALAAGRECVAANGALLGNHSTNLGETATDERASARSVRAG